MRQQRHRTRAPTDLDLRAAHPAHSHRHARTRRPAAKKRCSANWATLKPFFARPPPARRTRDHDYRSHRRPPARRGSVTACRQAPARRNGSTSGRPPAAHRRKADQGQPLERSRRQPRHHEPSHPNLGRMGQPRDRLRRIHPRRGPQERRTSHSANKTRGQDSRVHGSCTNDSTPPPRRSPPCITTTSCCAKNSSKAANSPSYKATADAKFPSSGRCLIDPNAHRLRRSNGPSLISQNATDPMSHETHGFWRTSSLRIYNNSPFLKS